MDAQSPLLISNSVVGVTPVVLSGALDQYNADSLKEQLLCAIRSLESSSPELLLDLTAVDHIDGCGLQVLLACKAGLKQGKLPLKGVDPSVRQWLKIAGADALYEFLEANG